MHHNRHLALRTFFFFQAKCFPVSFITANKEGHTSSHRSRENGAGQFRQPEQDCSEAGAAPQTRAILAPGAVAFTRAEVPKGS